MMANKLTADRAPIKGRLKKGRRLRRRIEEQAFTWLMRLALAGAAVGLATILIIIVQRGVGALSWQMITQPPRGDFYTGGGGGILNAIAGSFLLACGATLLASLIAVPVVLYMHTYAKGRRRAEVLRLLLDVMYGVPSIVYGAFGFALMLMIGLRASLLAGIIALTLVILPIMARAFDEVAQLAPQELTDTALSLGATRLEALGVLFRQLMPGLVTAVLLAFGRGIGDGAAVLFTAGFTDAMPGNLLRPAASLPVAILFQLNTPFPQVQARAYAAALVLTALVLIVSLLGQWSMRQLGKYVIR